MRGRVIGRKHLGLRLDDDRSARANWSIAAGACRTSGPGGAATATFASCAGTSRYAVRSIP
jgi:hypothetical protein